MEQVQVLLVDDDLDFVDLVSTYLKTIPGFTLCLAQDGKQALKKLEMIHPEVIVADVQMPLMNGYELCREIRTSLGLNTIPFIFCSKLSLPQERIRGLQIGADDYVIKPVNLEELATKIKRQLEKNRHIKDLQKSLEIRTPRGILSGNLAQLQVNEVLQVLDFKSSNQHKDLHVYLETLPKRTGSIYLEGRNLIHAETGHTTGLKAFYRMMQWTQGVFSVEYKKFGGTPSISGELTSWLLSALAGYDEYKLLRASLSMNGEFLNLSYTKPLFTQGFKEDTLEILQLIPIHRHIDKILDYCSLLDLEALRIIYQLLNLKYVTLSKA